jgi:hypothetical protein
MLLQQALAGILLMPASERRSKHHAPNIDIVLMPEIGGTIDGSSQESYG